MNSIELCPIGGLQCASVAITPHAEDTKTTGLSELECTQTF